MILVVGLILIMLIVWGIRASIRRARKKARARAEGARAVACKVSAEDAGDQHSPAPCSPS